MKQPIPSESFIPRPLRSWISPDGTTYPLDVAFNESHDDWAKANGKGNENRMLDEGWIRRAGNIFQTSEAGVEHAKAYIDRYEPKKKYCTIVTLREDGYWGLGTMPEAEIDSCGGWTKITVL